ncbi:MAG: hypothetical protein CVU44_01830 [Chloroflexi bacterium HGW-Chloroflexi-6]|nr:MAG: hypothetical protein CVU44_01830 [Chloroflexi bacterium HGW-Chloroflexi-6]
MGKTNQPKTDNLNWIKALLFPKKSKPIASMKPAVMTPPPAEEQAPVAVYTEEQAPVAAYEEQPVIVETTKTDLPQQTQAPRRGFMPIFWTVASIFSMLVNVILVIVLLVLARELFTLKGMVGDGLLGGLYQNFVLMDRAHIRTTIQVQTDVPVQFNLPVQTNTTVQLTEDTRIEGARVTLNTGGLNILSAPTNIILPAGTNLPIALDITVPVNTTIPIVLDVPVDIPLEETELHQPFVGLQEVVAPYYWMLLPDIQGPEDVPFCKPIPWLCDAFFAD